MKIGINNKFQIKQINNITDNTLTIIELPAELILEDSTFVENPDFPFAGWSEETILRYCYEVHEDIVKIYPYVPIEINQGGE